MVPIAVAWRKRVYSCGVIRLGASAGSNSEDGGEPSQTYPTPENEGTTILRRKHAIAQLVEALCYKSEGRGFYSSWCHWKFSLT